MSDTPGNDPNAGPIALQSIATASLGPVFVGRSNLLLLLERGGNSGLSSRLISSNRLGADMFSTGWMVQLIFYGFGLSLFVRYVTGPQYKADSRRIKLWLWAVVFAATGQAAITFDSIFHYGTSQRRDVDTLYAQTLADCFATVPTGIVGALVQSFLGLRAVSLFDNNLYRSLFITMASLLIMGGLIGSWLFVAASFMLRNNVTPPPGLSFTLANGWVCRTGNTYLIVAHLLNLDLWPTPRLWLWCCCIMDVLLTVTLSLLLYKRIVGFNSGTDSMLRSVIILSIETASYTATFALIAAILSDSFSDDSLLTNSTGAFYQPLSSFYLISFIVTLASRQGLREKTDGYNNNDVSSPGVYATRYPNNSAGISPKPPPSVTSASRVRAPTPQLVRMQTLGDPRSDEDEEMDLKHSCSRKEVRIEM
ncbi:BZ3500_MvSof-1268-A1-R1_Chr3-1g06027 [Microbotryum saponariae]|uniref:BZ3500_MvSof-1268-A1-R1_Chr3-1g06027 protein n=1 Tax=Microbotryum saponariae TaxID=289078 RepID=A0A2X0NIU8_9BASI|nr:BZ3500_MvSof-1268-A1-R1_Chr3-1g06027 [Microbotryum saponariae]SCZ99870.1 BZ3501_MvSof-1269-A2-R1_Chr12-2g03539 [Microbotryum saponariae]SDA03826.1 BZ3501_MvSof-1269-A2-R1_Chr3-2g05712 [Microbotryum saponariae]SDA05217.1 BZ3501_MvSof-1269-A2-R1_Chr3-1g05697 [Microbotryum saponariae]